MWFEKLNNKEVEELEKGLSSIQNGIKIKLKVNKFGLYEIGAKVDNETKESRVFSDFSLNLADKDFSVETLKQLNLAYCSFMQSKFGQEYLEMAKEDYKQHSLAHSVHFYEWASLEGPNSEKAKHHFQKMEYNNDMWIALDKQEKSLQKTNEIKNEL